MYALHQCSPSSALLAGETHVRRASSGLGSELPDAAHPTAGVTLQPARMRPLLTAVQQAVTPLCHRPGPTFLFLLPHGGPLVCLGQLPKQQVPQSSGVQTVKRAVWKMECSRAER